MFGIIAGVAGSLIGGALSRNDAKKATRSQNKYNDPINQRQRLEDAGFNPAAYLEGAGNQAMPRASGQMGTAIAESAGVIGSFMNENSAAQKRATELDKQNQQLRDQLRNSVLRPQVGGILSGVTALNGGQSETAVKSYSIADREFIGPLPLVNVYSTTADKWSQLHPMVARRMELQDGDALLAEDHEAILGDLGSEIINTPNAVNEATGFGKTYWSFPSSGRNSSAPSTIDSQPLPFGLSPSNIDALREYYSKKESGNVQRLR